MIIELRLILGFLLGFFNWFCNSVYLTTCRGYSFGDLIMNGLYSTTLETQIEMIIAIYLNFSYGLLVDYRLVGEALSMNLNVFVGILLLALPTQLIKFLYNNIDEEKLKSEDYKNYYGTLYEDVKLENKWTKGFTLIVFMRRLIYLVVMAVGINSKTVIS